MPTDTAPEVKTIRMTPSEAFACMTEMFNRANYAKALYLAGVLRDGLKVRTILTRREIAILVHLEAACKERLGK